MFGDPEELVCVVGVGLDHDYWKANADKIMPNIHAIGDALTKKLGSTLNTIPSGFHLCVTNNHASNKTYVANFKQYLKEVVETIDPLTEPKSIMGSAYLQMGKQ